MSFERVQTVKDSLRFHGRARIMAVGLVAVGSPASGGLATANAAQTRVMSRDSSIPMHRILTQLTEALPFNNFVYNKEAVAGWDKIAGIKTYPLPPSSAWLQEPDFGGYTSNCRDSGAKGVYDGGGVGLQFINYRLSYHGAKCENVDALPHVPHRFPQPKRVSGTLDRISEEVLTSVRFSGSGTVTKTAGTLSKITETYKAPKGSSGTHIVRVLLTPLPAAGSERTRVTIILSS